MIMLDVMSNDPFHFGIQPSERPIDPFEDAIDRITFPIDPFRQDEKNDGMRHLFLNSFIDEDENDINNDEVKGEIHPQRYDIICGKDKLSHSHIGNKRFRVIIERNRERYQNAATRDEKTGITGDIIAMIRSCRPGGRFLKLCEDTNKWYDVGDEYAREKVSHALRSAKDPSQRTIRKKRKSLPKVHNDFENAVFSRLLQQQQLIFKNLVEQEEQEAYRQNKRPRLDDSLVYQDEIDFNF